LLPRSTRAMTRCRVGPAPFGARPPQEPAVAHLRHPARASPSGPTALSLTIRSLGSRSSAGPFTTASAAASNLSVGWGVVVIFFCWAHLTASASFRVRAQGPVSGQLSTAISWRTDHSRWFPVAFRPPALRFSVILFPPGDWALLTVGSPASISCRDPDGVTAFRTHELRSGWAPSGPRGRWRTPRPRRLKAGHPPLSSGQSLHPASTLHYAGLRLTRHQRGFKQFARPIFPSPVAARMEAGSPWA
jgi:hypothetical protein